MCVNQGLFMPAILNLSSMLDQYNDTARLQMIHASEMIKRYTV